MKFKKNIIIISLIAFSLAPLGQSAWVTFYDTKVKSYSKNITTDITKIAYTINDSKVVTYYLTIESALEHTTSGTVYVIPGTNPTITRDCEIKSGVTLCIPYDDNGDGTHTDFTNLENQSNDGFADKDAAAVAKNRKNLITIASGITLTNNGILDVAGKVGIGSGNQKPSGFTLGDYCEILLESNAKIQNNGSINLYGYIKESSRDNGSSVVNTSTGSMKMPYTIYDYRGGSFSSSAYFKNSMPFSYFDFPNCHAKQVFQYGSKLTGIALLYASSTYYSSELLVLATNNEACLFKMSNGKVVINYIASNFGYTTADVSNSTTKDIANYTKITIDGDLSLSSFIISVAGSTVNSASVECPISYKFQVTQNTGTLTIASKMKFLSGSSLTIAKDANCIINAGTIFYEGYTPKMVTGGSNFSPQNMGRAKFLVNGNLTIDSNFGGIINSDSSTGTITTGENFVDYFETNERLDSDKYYDGWNRHIEYAEAYKLIDSVPSTFRLEKSKTYQLCATGNYWYASANTDISSFTLDNPSGKSSDKAEKTYAVTATYTYSNVTYSSANFSYQWVVSTSDSDSGPYTIIENPDSTMLTTNNNVATFTTPAATSASVYYKLTCTISFERKDTTKSNMSLTSGSYEAYYDSGCVLPTTLVLMADGTYKQAGKIEKGDMVISFNHETGKLEENVVIVNAHKNESGNVCNVLHLLFDNGMSTDLVYKHGYFDITMNKYVYLDIDNYLEFVGHDFVYVDSKLNRSKVRLISGEVMRMYTRVVSPVTANHLDLVTDNMLGLSACMDGLFNIFEYDPDTLAFDKEKMQRDIDKYGLLDYEYFKDYFPREIYDLLPCKYLGVSIGKGLITSDIIKSYILRWKNLLMQNMK